MIDYDNSPKALFFPEARSTVLGTAVIPSEQALAIEAARLAYLHFEANSAAKMELTAALALAGFGAPATFNDSFTGSQGYATIRKSDGGALLAFRGTQPTSPKDILLDLDFHATASGDWPGKVHHGFLRGAQALWPAVKSWLDGEGSNRRALLVCGHSLGAAVATLIAMRASATSLITIGSPRIGDEDFVNALEATKIQRTRIVDSLDIVAQIPPTFLGYRHPQDGVFIDAHGQVVPNPTSDQIDRDVDLELLFRFALPALGELPPPLSDHAAVNYLRAYWP